MSKNFNIKLLQFSNLIFVAFLGLMVPFGILMSAFANYAKMAFWMVIASFFVPGSLIALLSYINSTLVKAYEPPPKQSSVSSPKKTHVIRPKESYSNYPIRPNISQPKESYAKRLMKSFRNWITESYKNCRIDLNLLLWFLFYLPIFLLIIDSYIDRGFFYALFK